MISYLTFDYELHGDGSGDLIVDLLKPTEILLDVLKNQRVLGTFFIEILEFKVIEEWAIKTKNRVILNELDMIYCQIRNIYALGHSIQLHIHPQWYGAKFTENGWQLNFKNWSCASFTDESITTIDLFRYCYESLQEIIYPIDSSYRPFVFRAGSYCAQPSKKIYEAMMSVGLSYDSSVIPGANGYGLSIYSYDMRENYNPYPVSKSNFGNTGESSVSELPIFTARVFNFSRLVRAFFNSLFSKSKKKKISVNGQYLKKTSKFKLLKFAFSTQSQPFDPIYLTRLEIRFFLKRVSKLMPQSLVMVSHPKGLKSSKLLVYTIKCLKKKGYNFEIFELNKLTPKTRDRSVS